LIVDPSNAQEPVHLYFDGDDLFNPFRRRRGLPIGNLTSQFFANLYLDGFDHFVTEILRAPYVRYVDDFALFHNDPAVLAGWRLRIEKYLAGRRLKLHPRKTLRLIIAVRGSEPQDSPNTIGDVKRETLTPKRKTRLPAKRR